MAATKIKGKQVELDTDTTLAANSDEVIASQKAVKAYVTANSGSGLTQAQILNLITMNIL